MVSHSILVAKLERDGLDKLPAQQVKINWPAGLGGRPSVISGTKSSWHLITTAFFSNWYLVCHCSPCSLMHWRMGCNDPFHVCMEKWRPQETQEWLSVEVQGRHTECLHKTLAFSWPLRTDEARDSLKSWFLIPWRGHGPKGWPVEQMLIFSFSQQCLHRKWAHICSRKW